LGLEFGEMILEHAFDLSSSGFSTWNLHAVGRTRCNVNHLLELGMLEGLDGLWRMRINNNQQGQRLTWSVATSHSTAA
jgi:hypothetical protein